MGVFKLCTLKLNRLLFSNGKRSPAAIILPFIAVLEQVKSEKALFTRFFPFNRGTYNNYALRAQRIQSE